MFFLLFEKIKTRVINLIDNECHLSWDRGEWYAEFGDTKEICLHFTKRSGPDDLFLQVSPFRIWKVCVYVCELIYV